MIFSLCLLFEFWGIIEIFEVKSKNNMIEWY